MKKPLRRSIATIFLLLAVVLTQVGGCQAIENTARDAIAGAKGYISKALKQYPQCNQPNTDAVYECRIIHSTAAAQHLVGSALEIYCAGPSFEAGGRCNPPTDADRRGQLATKLKEAADQLQREVAAIRQLKGVIK